MKIHADMPSEEVQIQLIPLIDVIFCILTFFILAALQLTRQQAIGVDLPRASTGAPQMREMLVVTISPTGQLFVDKDLVDRASLRQRLEQYRQNRPNGLLVLNASKLAFYNDVVQVLDVMRSVGGDRVALATIPAEVNQPGATPSPGAMPGAMPTTGAPPGGVPGAVPGANPTMPGLPNDIFGNPNSTGVPGQGLPGQGLPGQGLPGQGLPGQGLPGQGLPGQGTSGQAVPGQTLPGQTPGEQR
jgi:biopolymer transport protein ExbD